MDTSNKKRIRIYINVRHSLELAKNIYEKHQAEGDESALTSIEDFSWEVTGPKIGFCLEKHKEAIKLSKNAEELFRQRDAVLAEISDIVKVSKSILRNKYTTCPEKLIEWGIVVFDNISESGKVPP